MFSHTSTRFFYISGGIFKFSGYQFQLSTVCGSCSGLFITTDVTIRIFPVPIEYWSGFGISSKIGRIPTRSEWLDSLGFETKIMDKSLGTLLHFWGVFQFTQLPNPPLNPQTKLDTYIQNFFQVSTLNRVGRENCNTISKRIHSLWTGLPSRVELGRVKAIFSPFPKTESLFTG